MKLHILSDLHIKFRDFVPPETDAEAVILAGDIGAGLEGVRCANSSSPSTVRPSSSRTICLPCSPSRGVTRTIP